MGLIDSLRPLLVELHAEQDVHSVNTLAGYFPKPQFFTARVWGALSTDVQKNPRITSLFCTSTMTKYKLPPEKYYSAQNAMATIGLTEIEANRILHRKSPWKTTEYLNNHYTELRERLNHADIIRIGSHDGASKSYDAVMKHFQTLTHLHFTPEQIVQMVSRDGGSKNLQAVVDHYPTLRSLGFTPEQIVQIVGHDGGSKNLQAVIGNIEIFHKLGFNSKQIVKIVGHRGGSKNLQAVIDHYPTLRALEFTPEQIVQMAGHDGGSHNLQAVTKYLDTLQTIKFSSSEVVQIMNHEGGSKNLEAVKDCGVALRAFGFSPRQIVQIVSSHGGSHNLQAVAQNLEALQAAELSTSQIVRMGRYNGGSIKLNTFLRNSITQTGLHSVHFGSDHFTWEASERNSEDWEEFIDMAMDDEQNLLDRRSQPERLDEIKPIAEKEESEPPSKRPKLIT